MATLLTMHPQFVAAQWNPLWWQWQSCHKCNQKDGVVGMTSVPVLPCPSASLLLLQVWPYFDCSLDYDPSLNLSRNLSLDISFFLCHLQLSAAVYFHHHSHIAIATIHIHSCAHHNCHNSHCPYTLICPSLTLLLLSSSPCTITFTASWIDIQI